jgi:hypothetical protein
MKSKLINCGILLTSLFGYLEWGGDQAMFLFQVEREVLVKLFINPLAVIHPFVVIPLAGQMILFLTLFQKQPDRRLSLAGVSGIGFFMLFILFIGIISMNFKICLSVMPFLIIALMLIFQTVKKGNNTSEKIVI